MNENRNRQARSYERKDKLFISGDPTETLADIILPGLGETRLLVNGALLTWQGEAGRKVWLNEAELSVPQSELQLGDSVAVGGWSLTFYDRRIEIAGAPPAAQQSDESQNRELQTTLLPVTGAAGQFKDHPYYKRSPRVLYQQPAEKIEIKAPPQKQSLTKGGLVQLIVPTLSTLAFTILMGFMMKRGPYIYMSIGMTVITTIFSVRNFLAQRKEIKEANRKREQVYKTYLLNLRRDIRRKRREEAEALAYQYPSAEILERLIRGCSSRLYERTGLDEDFLTVTLGYYSGASRVSVGYERKELEVDSDELSEEAKELAREYESIENIPLNVELKKSHLGLVGYKRNVHKQLKYLLLQLTFFHSYHDLQIVFIHHERYREEFAYLKWYPQMQIKSINVTGQIATEQARDQIIGSLQQLLKERQQKQEEEQQEVRFSPHFLFVIDEPGLIINHPIMEYLQSKELNLGFSFIYTTDQQDNLPENVKTVCLIENKEDGRLLLKQGERINRTFALQPLERVALEQTARILGGIIHEQGMKSQIPEAITFFDMFKVRHPEELNIRQRWEQNQSHKSLAVPLGVRAKDDYVELNLHEKAHGPHGLVAGTTGSGKSEIIQSYILSLAANFHPYEVGFLLIDYKGGGMANLFKELPHLLGTITNLDKAESMRAMASIKSELARRQQIFSQNDVNHINGYNQLFKLGKVAEPLPHLFLISDEFAELKKEQPEFMSELVSAARIGRSLGIHLILATQKPSGVVDDQIWTNSKFKLCLKVQNAGDSKEMLRTPDAANITQAGRAYLQVGNNEIYELFQSAWSGASYAREDSAAQREDDRVYLLNEIGQGELLNRDLGGTKESNQIKKTQLDVIVSHISEVYQELSTVAIKKPWLPSLSDRLLSPYTQEVRDSAVYQQLNSRLGLGLIDIPEAQEQREYILDLEKNGHILYMASGGYGKSMFLGHILLGLAMQNAVANLQMYILDLGNSALIPYKALPQVADYMGFDDSEKLEKFQKLILDRIAERKKLLAKAMTQNFHVYNQSGHEPLPAIVIAIDNYDVVAELGDRVIAFIQKVARDGAGLGIYLAVTITRENVMRGATKGNFKERIAGYNFVEGENNGFIGRSQVQIPEDKKGRALVKTDSINLMQLYISVPCEDEVLYNQALQERIRQVAAASSEERAPGIPTLPEVLHYEMLREYPGYVEQAGYMPLGIDTESLMVQQLNLNDGPGLVIGASGSGKTNMVKILLQTATECPVYLIENGEGALRSYGQQENVKYSGCKASIAATLDEIAEFITTRKERYQEECIEDPTVTIKEFVCRQPSVYCVVDNVQAVIELMEDKGSLDILVEAGRYGLRLLVTADNRLRKTTGSELLNALAALPVGAVLGSFREQNIFSNPRIKEDNRKVDIGYYYNRGVTKRIKVIENR